MDHESGGQRHTHRANERCQLLARHAKEGNAAAMHNVATLCLKGWAGEQKPQDCLAWYEKAALLGVDASRNSLAEAYDKGLFGIPVDKQRAQYWRAQIGKKAEL
jgi:TPR repeat protein